ncbi:PepSY-associated TM helix domain-containing protein [Pollutimonas bauzanensis]|uniref:PepSY-associated TM helix domain-containing protein n=1 Tax=Pollutimonas bauzanensis TaxID=658167 RepID=UPI000934F1AD|nr:PepSY-associated TM helix domain-containing protein [Pollutimonas bauzanensis]
MKSARSTRRWYVLHKWSSLICTGFLLILCLTGLPLIFSHEIEDWLDEQPLARVVPEGQPRAALDDMAAAAKRRYPAEVLRFIFIDDDEPRVTVVMAPSDGPRRDLDHRVEFDVRTGSVVKDDMSGAQRPATFMGVMLRLHADLFAGFTGEMLLAVIALVFVAAIVSGAALYAPSMKRLAFGAIRLRSSRTKWLDLHNLLGISVLVWMLCVAVTGVMNELSKPLSAVWRTSEMRALLTAYRGLAPAASPSPAQAAFETVQRALPGRNITSIIYPSASFSNPHHYLIWTNGSTPLTSRLFTAVLVDAKTGELTAIADMPVYLRALQLSRPLHFGDYGGLPLKILWALLDLITIAVLGSGLYLWFMRRRTHAARIGRPAEAGEHGRAAPVCDRTHR